MKRTSLLLPVALVLGAAVPAFAEEVPRTEISYEQALSLAAKNAPDVLVARHREAVANADIGIARTYPNPQVIGGTSTQAAKVSAGVSLPLILFGQIGAAERASRADRETVLIDTQATVNDVRSGSARAFVMLWLAERTATARADAAAVTKKLEAAVLGRVELGAAPQVEGLRVKAESLRADADAQEAAQLVDAAGYELGRFIGVPDGRALRAKGDPTVPDSPPALAALGGRVGDNPLARREDQDARASEEHARRERALVRPALTLDLGLDAFDPTLCPASEPSCSNPPINYRAQLAIDVPFFNQRGSYVEKERANAEVARARGEAERRRLTASLAAAYRTFEAVSARRKAIEEGVLPAAEAAAVATEDSYALGHAPLVAVLDAERARIDARISLINARAERASAWVDVMQALGWP